MSADLCTIASGASAPTIALNQSADLASPAHVKRPTNPTEDFVIFTLNDLWMTPVNQCIVARSKCEIKIMFYPLIPNHS